MITCQRQNLPITVSFNDDKHDIFSILASDLESIREKNDRKGKGNVKRSK